MNTSKPFDLQQAFAAAIRHHQAGRLAEAEAACRDILAVAPDHADSLHMRGLIATQQGRGPTAIEFINRAIALTRDRPVAAFHNNLGAVFQQLGKLDEAAAQYQRAIEIKPDYAKAHYGLGNIFKERGKLSEAEACFRRALKHQPDYIDAHNNLGLVLKDQERLEEAAASYGRALALNARFPSAHYNLGIVRMEQGRLDEAIASYERAIALIADDANMHWNQSLTYLLGGDFAAGWEKYEWRWRRKELPPRLFTQNPWDGESLAGRTILLHAEQGIGDTLNFIRYAPLVKAKGATVIVECQQGLARLLKSAAGIDQIVTAGEKLPAFDCHAPLLSLPRIFGTRLETIPAAVPYLAAEPELMEGWAQKLAALPGRKVGLAWRGNPTHANDRRRSIPVETIASLCATPGISWVSIQADARLEEIAVLSRHGPVLNAGPALNDWTDTAALVATLDLVVSVDTAVVHLAGALNKPAWVLLPFAPDWRWMLTREDSPWYPSVRLFRQPNPANWQDVVANVRAELTQTGGQK